jgi:hypothetical protein
MFYSVAQCFCAFSIFLTWMTWGPSTVQATCADGRPEPRVTCAYPSIGSTVSNEAAKSDSLLISEVPAAARRLTQKCLQAEQMGGTAPQECWRSAAIDARRFTQGVTGAAADQLRALGDVWGDLAQRLQQEQASVAAQTPKPSVIAPVSDSWKPKDFSSARMSKPVKKRKIAPKTARRTQSAAPKKSIRLAHASAPRVRKAKLKATLGKRSFAFARRKNLNINKTRVRNRKPVAAAPSLKCLFSPKSCKQ